MARRPVLWAMLIVGCLGGLVRLALLWQMPLIFTNDSVLYTHWAWAIAQGEPVGNVPSYRTPGYPVFLSGVLAVFGRDPMAVMAVQRLMGLIAAVTVAGVASAIVKRRRSGGLALAVGLVCGLVPAIDPRVLALEGFALSEGLSVFLAVLLFVPALAIARFRVWHLVWIGVLAGALCLVRPVFQVAVPLILLGMVLIPGPAGWKPRLVALALGAVAFGATVAPWLLYNHRRGVSGFGEGGGAVLWLGLGMSGRLDTSLAPTEDLAQEYERIVGDNPHSGSLHHFVFSIGTFHKDDVRHDIGQWAVDSVKAHPGSYIKGVLVAMLWQCDYLPGGTRPPERELLWIVQRAAVDPQYSGPASNMTIGGPPDAVLEPMAMDRPSRGAAWIFNAWAYTHHFGVLTLVLLVCAVAAGVVSLFRRRWTWALLIAGSGAVFASHAALLSPYARYSLPVWMVWAVTPAIVVAGSKRSESEPEPPKTLD
ncbi:MAG: ArnT family glycosyltransferase [Phycisphaerales bacterium JB064]